MHFSKTFHVYSLIGCIPVKTKNIKWIWSMEICVNVELPVWGIEPITRELTFTHCIWLPANTPLMYGYITSWVWYTNKANLKYHSYYLRSYHHGLLDIYRTFWYSFDCVSWYLTTHTIHELTLPHTSFKKLNLIINLMIRKFQKSLDETYLCTCSLGKTDLYK